MKKWEKCENCRWDNFDEILKLLNLKCIIRTYFTRWENKVFGDFCAFFWFFPFPKKAKNEKFHLSKIWIVYKKRILNVQYVVIFFQIESLQNVLWHLTHVIWDMRHLLISEVTDILEIFAMSPSQRSGRWYMINMNQMLSFSNGSWTHFI